MDRVEGHSAWSEISPQISPSKVPMAFIVPYSSSWWALHELVDTDRRRQTGAGGGAEERRGRGRGACFSLRIILAPWSIKWAKQRGCLLPLSQDRNNLNSTLHSSPLPSPRGTQSSHHPPFSLSSTCKEREYNTFWSNSGMDTSV